MFMTFPIVPWWQIKFGEEVANLVSNEILHGRVSMGETTSMFEEAVASYLNVKYCVATSSGTTALLMALLASGVNRGEVVAVQDRSWIAAAHAAHLLGASIQIIDVLKSSPRIDADHAFTVLDRKPKVLILVHMNGRSNEIIALVEKCRNLGVIVIEDSAQAIGSKIDNQFLGTFGDIGCFSLSVTKTVSAGQGGFCVTNSETIFNKLKSMRVHGTRDLLKPEWEKFGMNFRFTDIQAAIALSQLKLIKEKINQQNETRREYSRNIDHLTEMKIIEMKDNFGESGPYFDLFVRDANRASEYYLNNGIQTRQFYPPISTAKYLRIENRNETPNADYWFNHGLILPSGPALRVDQLDFVIEKTLELRL